MRTPLPSAARARGTRQGCRSVSVAAAALPTARASKAVRRSPRRRFQAGPGPGEPRLSPRSGRAPESPHAARAGAGPRLPDGRRGGASGRAPPALPSPHTDSCRARLAGARQRLPGRPGAAPESHHAARVTESEEPAPARHRAEHPSRVPPMPTAAQAGKAVSVAAAALPAGHPSRVRLLPRPGGGAYGRAPLRGSQGPSPSPPMRPRAPAQGCRRGGASGRAPPAPRRSRVLTLTHAARVLPERGRASRAGRERLPSPALPARGGARPPRPAGSRSRRRTHTSPFQVSSRGFIMAWPRVEHELSGLARFVSEGRRRPDARAWVDFVRVSRQILK